MRTLKQSYGWFLTVGLFAVVLFASRTSAAQQAAVNQGFGVGAEATTTGIVGATFVYDAAIFHIDALLGANILPNQSTVAVAGRFFFPVHRGRMADFSLGPGVGFSHLNVERNPNDRTSVNALHLEGAAQIRAFIVPNVALSASAGVGAVFANGENSAVIGGQAGASLGVTYFFF